MDKDKTLILKFDKLIIQIFNVINKITLSALQEYGDYLVKDIIENKQYYNMKVEEHVNKLIKEIGLYKKYYRTSMKLVNKNDTVDMENNHLALFKNMYYQYLDDILYEDCDEIIDDWIQDNNLLIWYGDTKNKRVSDRNGCGCVIRLTEIYQYANQLEDKFAADEQAEENEYANLLLLNLYKIFVLFASDKEKKILYNHIHNIEDELGISNQKSGGFVDSILNSLSHESMNNISELIKSTYTKLKEKSLVSDNITDEQLDEMIHSFNKDKIMQVFSDMGDIIQTDEDGKPTLDVDNIPDKLTDFFKTMTPMSEKREELKDYSSNEDEYDDEYED